MRLSARVKSVTSSLTLSLDAKAKRLIREGVNVINFGVGEPDFDTPEHIKIAGIDAIRAGFTKYTPSPGIVELREAICKKLREDNGLHYEPSQILVSVGAKHSIYNSVMALCGDGDEVIIPAPYWVSYPEMVKLAGGTPVIVQTTAKTGFKLTAEDLRGAVTTKTVALILNTPTNPTGSVYSVEELQALGRVCLEEDIAVISDEVYEKLVYEGEHISFSGVLPGLKELILTVNGVSKAYSMTGWRIGYTAGPEPVIKAMNTVQSHSTSNPTSISQKAALAGLLGPQEPLELMRLEFKKRRDYIVDRLNSMPGITCLIPPGAFYVFPDVTGIIGSRVDGRTVNSDAELADVLLDVARVSVVPGAAFGSSGNLRFSMLHQ